MLSFFNQECELVLHYQIHESDLHLANLLHAYSGVIFFKAFVGVQFTM
jgi:hypothetical protein